MKVWTEPEVRGLLSAHGIEAGRFETARTEQEAAEKAQVLGYPVAMKVVSRQIVHKTDAGGVKLGLADEAQVRRAFHEILKSCREYRPEAEIEGVIITPMCGEGVDVIAGLVLDPQFGPVLMVGLGGIFVEVFEDVAFRIAPVTFREAMEMVSQLRGYRLLQGFRGKPPASVEVLAELLTKLSRLPFEFTGGEIRELDLNPVRVLERGKGVAILDARMVSMRGPC